MSASLSKKEQENANKEREVWEKRAEYWVNALPSFNEGRRYTLASDIQTAFNFEQLELNKELSTGIKWNNRFNIALSIINLVLFAVNIILLFWK